MFPRYNKFYRYPKRYTKSSVGKITQSRNFRASAANMTQNGLFSVNVRTPQTLQVQANSANSWAQLDVPALINSSAMHRQLSNVFDQYRIEKVTIRFKPLATTNTGSATVSSFLNFFTVVDRSGLSAALTVDDLRTYASYKETVWSMNGDTPRPHVMNLGQADMVSRTEYYDSKKVAGFPTVAYGCDVGQTVSANTAYSFTVEIDAQVRYRGVRLDTSNAPIFSEFRVSLLSQLPDAPFGSKREFTYANESITFTASSADVKRLVILVEDVTQSGVDFLRIAYFRLNNTVSTRVPANTYYWTDEIANASANEFIVGFFNAITNRVDYWIADYTTDQTPTLLFINKKYGTYDALFPEFYPVDEDPDEPVDP